MRTQRGRTRHGNALAAIVVMFGFVAAAGAQRPPAPPQPETPARPQSGMAEKCQAMMTERQAMMAQLKEADQRLDALVAKMNAASGPEKVDATAAVVTEMVAQRKSMRERMVAMQERMMAHMGEHMQAGPASMHDCPAMKMKMKMD